MITTPPSTRIRATAASTRSPASAGRQLSRWCNIARGVPALLENVAALIPSQVQHIIGRVRKLSKTERWQSGRMRRFAKPLYGLTPVPRVRIPPSPPVLSCCKQ